MNKECKEFLRSIKCAFPIFRKNEKRFYIDFSLALKEYAKRYPNCTKKDLVEYFGAPKDIVIMYYNNMESNVYYKILKQSQYIRHFLIAVTVWAVTILIIETYPFFGLRKIFAKSRLLFDVHKHS